MSSFNFIKSTVDCMSLIHLKRTDSKKKFIFIQFNSGVTLSREPDGMWIYNRSLAPVFVHSPTLSDIDSRTLVVYRVPPGHCLRAFDHIK